MEGTFSRRFTGDGSRCSHRRDHNWDNPNVFQICILRDVRAPIARRQQIGRGVRLPVNQDGKHVQDERVNVLTVIANEDFSAFVRAYQQELLTHNQSGA